MLHQAAAELALPLHKAEPHRADLGRVLGFAYNKLVEREPDAPEALARAIETCEIFRRHARAEPDRTDLKRNLSYAISALAIVHQRRGEVVEARRAFADALDLRVELVVAEPHRESLQRDLANAVVRLSELEASATDPEVGTLDRCLRGWEKLHDAAGSLGEREPKLRVLLEGLAGTPEPRRAAAGRLVLAWRDRAFRRGKRLPALEELAEAWRKTG